MDSERRRKGHVQCLRTSQLLYCSFPSLILRLCVQPSSRGSVLCSGTPGPCGTSRVDWTTAGGHDEQPQVIPSGSFSRGAGGWLCACFMRVPRSSAGRNWAGSDASFDAVNAPRKREQVDDGIAVVQAWSQIKPVRGVYDHLSRSLASSHREGAGARASSKTHLGDQVCWDLIRHEGVPCERWLSTHSDAPSCMIGGALTNLHQSSAFARACFARPTDWSQSLKSSPMCHRIVHH